MRKLILILISLIFLGCNDLVMKYQMDECDLQSNQKVKDHSDFHNDATAKHTSQNSDGKYPWTCQDFGAIICDNFEFKGEGYNVPEENNKWYTAQYYIEAPDADQLSPLSEHNEMTLGGWFKTSKSGTLTIISKLNEYRVFIQNGKLKVTIWNKYGSPFTKNIKSNVNNGKWHFFAVAAKIENQNWSGTKKRLRLKVYYGDGKSDNLKKKTYTKNDFKPTQNTDNNLFIGATNWGGTITNFFDGFLDELSMFKKQLSDSDIQTIYVNSKNHKDTDENGNAVERDCECVCHEESKPSAFNAIDYVSENNCNAVSDWDNNITTKISNEEFNLTILSKNPNLNVPIMANISKIDLYIYQDFENGKCKGDYKVVNICNNCGNTNANGCMKVSMKYQNSAKCVLVHIKGKQINSSDENESDSTDNFAIRPYEFNITNIPSKIRAGEDFNLTFRALDSKGESVNDYNESIYISKNSVNIEYNETKNECLNGTLIKNSGNFENGEANVSLNYSEVGELNISIREINGSEFAKIDEDDTNDSQRFIKKSSTILKFIPHHFEANLSLRDWNKEKNFTYFDDKLSVYGTIEINITSMNANNKITKNYNKECYAKDVDINISLNKKTNNQFIGINKYRYIIEDIYANKSSLKETDINKSIYFTYKKENFNTDNNGTTWALLLLNFDKNISVFANPLKLDVNKTDVNDSDNNYTIFNESGTIKFLYGNLLLNDVISKKKEFNITSYFVIYDENESDDLKPDSKEIVYNLYHNIWHKQQDGNVTDSEIVVSKDYNSSNTTNKIEVKLIGINDGNITFEVKRKYDINFAVVHLLSPNLEWLWYSKFNEDYNVTKGSTCLNHFCFSITWQKSKKIGEVGSGKFRGTEANVTEDNSTKTGVKIFR